MLLLHAPVGSFNAFELSFKMRLDTSCLTGEEVTREEDKVGCGIS